MDINADKPIPTTDDQELANLLAGLSQEKHDVSLAPSEETGDAAVATAATTDDTASTDATVPTDTTETPVADETTSEPVAEAVPVEATPVETPVDPTKPVDTTGVDVASLSTDATDIATPNPMNVIDELNARDTNPAIVNSATTIRPEPTVDELATPPGAKPLEPLELDDAIVAAASDEVAQKTGTGTESATNETPSAAEEINNVRDKILNYLSEMIRDINQPPREKFETVVSILRGTGDRSLLKGALETAMQIEDPSDKAKALVELVNALDELSAKK